MKAYIEERTKEVAKYIIESKATIRKAAKVFGVSKSTIEKDVRDRLPRIAPQYVKGIEEVINYNKSERHIRGGNTTKLKWINN